MEGTAGVAYNENDLNLKATELRLGLPGTGCNEEPAVSGTRNYKRPLPETTREECGAKENALHDDQETSPAPKAQVVGWPPIRSYRRNILQPKKAVAEAAAGIYVKVSMDGAPYLRKIDLNVYKGYSELLGIRKHVQADHRRVLRERRLQEIRIRPNL